MKNFIRTTAYFFVFAAAGILFQISCSNSDDVASLTAAPTVTNKLLIVKKTGVDQFSIWTADYDGANLVQITPTLPANMMIHYGNNGVSSGPNPKFSQDGQRVFFSAIHNTTGLTTIYSCDLSGNNVQEVLAAASGESIGVQDIN